MFKIKSLETIGILFAIFSYLSFSLLDVIQKTLIIYYSVFQLLFIKYLFTFLLSLFESWRKKNNQFYLTSNLKIQILRSLLSIIESGCFVLAFRFMGLADVHSIGASAPIIVVVLAVILLKEKVTTEIWVLIFIGFIGVLTIMRPGLSVFDINSIYALSGAFFVGLYQIVTRKISQKDKNETSLFYQGFVGIITMGCISIIYWQPITLNFLPLFFGMAFFYSIAAYFQIIALSKARASMIQPFHYTLMFWAVIFGYIFYGDLPDFFTIVGGLIIVCSGIYALHKQKR